MKPQSSPTVIFTNPMMSSEQRNYTNITILTFLLLLFVPQFSLSLSSSTQVYVVYMGSTNGDKPGAILKQNHLMLTALHKGSTEQAQASHIYSYKHGFKGFAAKLTPLQVSQISKMEGVVSVFPNLKRNLHTTHSWDFMGLAGEEAMEIPGHSTKNQENVIIGFIDTGIWPESPSFTDHDMPPVPSSWKGKCQTGEAFNASSCNRKVIGARYYMSGYQSEEGSIKGESFKSPRDSSGHGSHTASTAAGRYVTNMNYKGLGSGGARGGAPMARIAVYKTCWDSGCYDVDLLAAFDDAIKDGVHILSLSLGPDAPQGDYFNDAISVGSFHAVTHGVVVVSSVGNNGNQGTATNLAPWLITVAATSTDRDFSSSVVLGDGSNYKGESLSLLEMNSFTKIMPASEANGGYFTPYQSSYCLESSLDDTKAKGNVLICRHSGSSMESKLAKSMVVKDAGGVGMILIDEEDKDIAIPFAIAAATVGNALGDKILSYINHTSKPTSRIFSAKTMLGFKPAPQIAAFSSKGPNSLTPEILKPDIAAPGLNILAAWSPANEKMDYNILSGTSMACPHVTGIVSLIKAVNPSWSPSAMKSALMTTATIYDKNKKLIKVDPEGKRATPFDYGAGFINPSKVLDPGLLYDGHGSEYKKFLCSIGYDQKSIRLITGDNSTCMQSFRTASSLNLPSITIPNLQNNFSVVRMVTNVGRPQSIYESIVYSPTGITVNVVPKRLVFKSYGEKLKFVVNFKVNAPIKGYVFGYLTWRNGEYNVTSPLVVRVQTASNLGLLR